ncbi:flagellar basal body rod modification protein [bacterium BMS3Abin05]|nr:flagellar basal body rod modification protein [bacterium BMS3Abin05]GBE27032.1 flagellar basal body rod modification protein [bacterium BMS3Bbin03]
MKYKYFFLSSALFFYTLAAFSNGMAQSPRGSLIVQWDPNTESDLAGYRVYYGTASRSYSHQIDVGNVTQYKIANLEEGKVYYIALTAYDYWNNESNFSKEVSAAAKFNSMPPEASTPDVLILYQNYPNPFNPETTLSFNVPETAYVSLSIWNVKGQLVNKLIYRKQSAGLHHAIWNGQDKFGQNVPSGTYFARLKSEKFVLSQKLLLIR